MIFDTKPLGYFFYFGEIYIISDAPGAELRIKEHPELQAKPLAELEALPIKSINK